MRNLPEALNAPEVEGQAQEFWRNRNLPPSPAQRRDRGGPPVHLLVRPVAPAGPLRLEALQQTLVADVALRAYLLLERTASGPLLFTGDSAAEQRSTTLRELAQSGIWFGQGASETLRRSDLDVAVAQMVSRLAETSVLVARDAPVRWCPRCRQPRGPGSLAYVDEQGTAYLVRFPLKDVASSVSALVWTDALWKLLGTNAVLLNPESAYVVARYRRSGVEERILVSKSSLGRLREWFPDCEVEVLEERSGAAWKEFAYRHPLGTEYPALQLLPPPSGLLHPSTEVGDSGTGLVPLTPAHGASDAQIAQSLGIPGWPVISADGLTERELAHKYHGLPLETAQAFILRDLQDGGAIFAQLGVRHGVPRCGSCGSPLFWRPGRAWLLEPDRIDAERLAVFGRLLPREPVPLPSERVPWPVSETEITPDVSAPLLAECTLCSRLAPPTTGSGCPCGGQRVEVRRRLLPGFSEVLYAWARLGPFPTGEGVWLIVPERRRGPSLLAHLVALFAISARPAEIRLSVVPTLPEPRGALSAATKVPVDAIRTALIRAGSRGSHSTPLEDLQSDEARHLRKFWELAARLTAAMVRDDFVPEGGGIAAERTALLDEDRALVSRFERMRIDVLAGLAAGRFAEALSRIHQFVDGDVRREYLALVRARLDEPNLTVSKTALYRVWAHVLSGLAELWAPFAPHVMETIYRTFREPTRSLFESSFLPVQQSLVDPAAEKLVDALFAIQTPIEGIRRSLGLPIGFRWRRLLLSTRDEETADQLRAASAAVQRLIRADAIEIASPAHPREGREILVQPVLPEIQRIYRSAAARVARLITQTPGRRVREGLANQSLSVVVDGQLVKITSQMVELSDSLPAGTIVLPWAGGEIYLELSGESPPDLGDLAIGLSPEAYRLVRTLRHRLARRPSGSSVREAWVEISGPVADELRGRLQPIAQALGLERIEVVSTGIQFLPGETTWGRIPRGVRWRIWLPGAPNPRRVLKSRGRRATPVPSPSVGESTGPPAVDYLSDAVRARETAVRLTLEQLDSVVGVPILGPSKLAAAWEAGYHSFEEVSHAPFEGLAAVPGFGPYVAREVLRHFGAVVPDRIWSPHRPVPEDAVPAPVRQASPTTDGGADRDDERGPPPEVVVPVLSEPASVPPAEGGSGQSAIPAERAPGPHEPAPPSATDPRPQKRDVVSALGTPVGGVAVPLLPLESVPELPKVGSEAPPIPEVSRPGVSIYLEDASERAWSEFLSITDSGIRGLCLTREFPDRLRPRIGSRDVSIVWLSNVGRQNTVRPSDLPLLLTMIHSALDEGQVEAVLLEGLEYLVTVNSLPPVMELLNSVQQLAEGRHAQVWVPVDPRLLTPTEVEALRLTFPLSSGSS